MSALSFWSCPPVLPVLPSRAPPALSSRAPPALSSRAPLALSADCLLREYGLPADGDLDSKRRFAMGAFLWPDQY